MVRHIGASWGLLAAVAALKAVSAARESFDDFLDEDYDDAVTASQNRSQGTRKCCCRGPKPFLCYMLEEEELDKRKVRNGGRQETFDCPAQKGYYDTSHWKLADTPPGCEPGDAPKTRPTGVPVGVGIFWIPHAWSCGDAYEDSESAGGGRSYPDPPLTDASIHRAHKLGPAIIQKIEENSGGLRPIVFTTNTVRGMETALHNFPGWPAHPIPYASSGGSPRQWSWKDQKEKITRGFTPDNDELWLLDEKGVLADADRSIFFDVAPLKDDPLEDPPLETHPGFSSKDARNFLQHLNNFLPGALQELVKFPSPGESFPFGRPGQGNNEISVVIISDPKFIREALHLKGCWQLPKNNEVLMQTMTFDWGAWDASLTPSGTCQRLFTDDFIPGPPDSVCEPDVARCSDQENKYRPTTKLKKYKDHCEALRVQGQEGYHSIVKRDWGRKTYAQPIAATGQAEAEAERRIRILDLKVEDRKKKAATVCDELEENMKCGYRDPSEPKGEARRTSSPVPWSSSTPQAECRVQCQENGAECCLLRRDATNKKYECEAVHYGVQVKKSDMIRHLPDAQDRWAALCKPQELSLPVIDQIFAQGVVTRTLFGTIYLDVGLGAEVWLEAKMNQFSPGQLLTNLQVIKVDGSQRQPYRRVQVNTTADTATVECERWMKTENAKHLAKLLDNEFRDSPEDIRRAARAILVNEYKELDLAKALLFMNSKPETEQERSATERWQVVLETVGSVDTFGTMDRHSLGIRMTPSMDGPELGKPWVLPWSTVFSVSETITRYGMEGGPVSFLRLADGRGWVPDREPGGGRLCKLVQRKRSDNKWEDVDDEEEPESTLEATYSSVAPDRPARDRDLQATLTDTMRRFRLERSQERSQGHGLERSQVLRRSDSTGVAIPVKSKERKRSTVESSTALDCSKHSLDGWWKSPSSNEDIYVISVTAQFLDHNGIMGDVKVGDIRLLDSCVVTLKMIMGDLSMRSGVLTDGGNRINWLGGDYWVSMPAPDDSGHRSPTREGDKDRGHRDFEQTLPGVALYDSIKVKGVPLVSEEEMQRIRAGDRAVRPEALKVGITVTASAPFEYAGRRQVHRNEEGVVTRVAENGDAIVQFGQQCTRILKEHLQLFWVTKGADELPTTRAHPGAMSEVKFTITVDIKKGSRSGKNKWESESSLGAVLERDGPKGGDKLKITKVKDKGAIAEHNVSPLLTHGQQVEAGDFITAVDAAKANCKAMEKELKKKGPKTITLTILKAARHQETSRGGSGPLDFSGSDHYQYQDWEMQGALTPEDREELLRSFRLLDADELYPDLPNFPVEASLDHYEFNKEGHNQINEESGPARSRTPSGRSGAWSGETPGSHRRSSSLPGRNEVRDSGSLSIDEYYNANIQESTDTAGNNLLRKLAEQDTSEKHDHSAKAWWIGKYVKAVGDIVTDAYKIPKGEEGKVLQVNHGDVELNITILHLSGADRRKARVWVNSNYADRLAIQHQEKSKYATLRATPRVQEDIYETVTTTTTERIYLELEERQIGDMFAGNYSTGDLVRYRRSSGEWTEAVVIKVNSKGAIQLNLDQGTDNWISVEQQFESIKPIAPGGRAYPVKQDGEYTAQEYEKFRPLLKGGKEVIYAAGMDVEYNHRVQGWIRAKVMKVEDSTTLTITIKYFDVRQAVGAGSKASRRTFRIGEKQLDLPTDADVIRPVVGREDPSSWKAWRRGFTVVAVEPLKVQGEGTPKDISMAEVGIVDHVDRQRGHVLVQFRKPTGAAVLGKADLNKVLLIQVVWEGSSVRFEEVVSSPGDAPEMPKSAPEMVIEKDYWGKVRKVDEGGNAYIMLDGQGPGPRPLKSPTMWVKQEDMQKLSVSIVSQGRAQVALQDPPLDLQEKQQAQVKEIVKGSRVLNAPKKPKRSRSSGDVNRVPPPRDLTKVTEPHRQRSVPNNHRIKEFARPRANTPANLLDSKPEVGNLPVCKPADGTGFSGKLDPPDSAANLPHKFNESYPCQCGITTCTGKTLKDGVCNAVESTCLAKNPYVVGAEVEYYFDDKDTWFDAMVVEVKPGGLHVRIKFGFYGWQAGLCRGGSANECSRWVRTDLYDDDVLRPKDPGAWLEIKAFVKYKARVVAAEDILDAGGSLLVVGKGDEGVVEAVGDGKNVVKGRLAKSRGHQSSSKKLERFVQIEKLGKGEIKVKFAKAGVATLKGQQVLMLSEASLDPVQTSCDGWNPEEAGYCPTELSTGNVVSPSSDVTDPEKCLDECERAGAHCCQWSPGQKTCTGRRYLKGTDVQVVEGTKEELLHAVLCREEAFDGPDEPEEPPEEPEESHLKSRAKVSGLTDRPGSSEELKTSDEPAFEPFNLFLEKPLGSPADSWLGLGFDVVACSNETALAVTHITPRGALDVHNQKEEERSKPHRVIRVGDVIEGVNRQKASAEVMMQALRSNARVSILFSRPGAQDTPTSRSRGPTYTTVVSNQGLKTKRVASVQEAGDIASSVSAIMVWRRSPSEASPEKPKPVGLDTEVVNRGGALKVVKIIEGGAVSAYYAPGRARQRSEGTRQLGVGSRIMGVNGIRSSAAEMRNELTRIDRSDEKDDWQVWLEFTDEFTDPEERSSFLDMHSGPRAWSNAAAQVVMDSRGRFQIGSEATALSPE